MESLYGYFMFLQNYFLPNKPGYITLVLLQKCTWFFLKFVTFAHELQLEKQRVCLFFIKVILNLIAKETITCFGFSNLIINFFCPLLTTHSEHN